MKKNRIGTCSKLPQTTALAVSLHPAGKSGSVPPPTHAIRAGKFLVFALGLQNYSYTAMRVNVFCCVNELSYLDAQPCNVSLELDTER